MYETEGNMNKVFQLFLLFSNGGLGIKIEHLKCKLRFKPSHESFSGVIYNSAGLTSFKGGKKTANVSHAWWRETQRERATCWKTQLTSAVNKLSYSCSVNCILHFKWMARGLFFLACLAMQTLWYETCFFFLWAEMYKSKVCTQASFWLIVEAKHRDQGHFLPLKLEQGDNTFITTTKVLC